jgi:hypothetical protein
LRRSDKGAVARSDKYLPFVWLARRFWFRRELSIYRSAL